MKKPDSYCYCSTSAYVWPQDLSMQALQLEQFVVCSLFRSAPPRNEAVNAIWLALTRWSLRLAGTSDMKRSSQLISLSPFP